MEYFKDMIYLCPRGLSLVPIAKVSVVRALRWELTLEI